MELDEQPILQISMKTSGGDVPLTLRREVESEAADAIETVLVILGEAYIREAAVGQISDGVAPPR